MADERFLIALHHGYMTWSLVCLVSLIKQNQCGREQTQTCITNKELLFKYRIIFLSLIHAGCRTEKVLKMFEGLSNL